MLKIAMRISLEEIIKAKSEFERVINEYQELVVIGMKDVTVNGELSLVINYTSEAKLESNLTSVMYRMEMLKSYIKVYEYLINCFNKLNILNEYKDELILHSIDFKIKNKEYSKKCPYMNYHDYDQVSINELCELLGEKTLQENMENIDYKMLENVMMWLMKKDMFGKYPTVDIVSSIESEGIFKVATTSELLNYLEERIQETIQTEYNISDKFDRYVLAKLRANKRFYQYVDDSDYDFKNDLLKNERESYSSDMKRFKDFISDLIENSMKKIVQIDYVQANITATVNAISNNLIDDSNKTYKHIGKPSLKQIFNFNQMRLLASYRIFNSDTLRFISNNVEDEEIRNVLEFLIHEKKNAKNNKKVF